MTSRAETRFAARSPRLGAAILGLALAFGGAGGLSPAMAQDGAPMFPALADHVGDVAQLTIQNRRYEIVLELRDGVWVAADRGDYPVLPDLVPQTLTALAALRQFEVRTEDPALFDQLDVVGPGPDTEDVYVKAVAANGDVLAEAIIGQPTAITAPPPRSGTLLRRVDENIVWLAEGGFFVPNLFYQWFDQLLGVPGRDVARVTVSAGATLQFDAMKVDFATGDYELVFVDRAAVGNVPVEGATTEDNVVRAIAQALLATGLDNAAPRESITFPSNARTVQFETQTGLTVIFRVMTQKGAGTWVSIDATAAPGGTAAEMAATITTETQRWVFQLPESRITGLTRPITDMVLLPPAEPADGIPPYASVAFPERRLPLFEAADATQTTCTVSYQWRSSIRPRGPAAGSRSRPGISSAGTESVMRNTGRIFAGLGLGVAMMAAGMGSSAAQTPAGVHNVVLVHGAWADGSGWRGVYDLLVAAGYTVAMVQNPLTSLADDVAAVDRVLARMDGPTILVGPSYGGAVITEAGDDPKVVGLVYVAAFVPDVGESPFGLLAGGPPPPIEVGADGFAFLNRDAFIHAFAAGLDPAFAAFLADVQIPIAVGPAGSAPLTVAAWHDKPSWYVVSANDQIIPPDAQRMMAGRAGATVVEQAGAGHIAFVVEPQLAADTIMQAAVAATP
jgi:predicted alpha/beta hydrolase family esterase